MSPPIARYDHLLLLIDDTGILEHSKYGIPRREHGYTVDDAARALIVLCDAQPRPHLKSAIPVLLGFVMHALGPNGRFHNRLGYDRRWSDVDGSDDTQGRAIWALGVATASAPRPEWRAAARSTLERARVPQSPHLRPHAYAAFGAHALWRICPEDEKATALLQSAATRFEKAPQPWPEPRLNYANGRLPDAMLAIGEALDRRDPIDRGLEALAWLDEVETRGGHYSFTPVGGWEPGEPRPGFDQQPIEAAAIAGAAERAWNLTADRRWHDAVFRARSWLSGDNDVDVALYDPATGACRDGLTSTGANENRGAESTIAGLAVLQACHRVATLSPGGAEAPTRERAGHP